MCKVTDIETTDSEEKEEAEEDSQNEKPIQTASTYKPLI